MFEKPFFKPPEDLFPPDQERGCIPVSQGRYFISNPYPIGFIQELIKMGKLVERVPGERRPR